MVLSSQMARAGTGRRHMTTGRRRRSRWRWAIPLLLIAIAVVYGLWPAAQSPPAAAVRTRPPATSRSEPKAAGNHVATPVPRPPALASTNRTADLHTRQSPTSTNTTSAAVSTPQGNLDRPAPVQRQQIALASTPPTPVLDKEAGQADGAIARGLQFIQMGRLLDARNALNASLTSSNTLQSQTIRTKLAQINQTLVFSSRVLPGDPLVESYTIQAGDLLSTIAPRYQIPYQLIELINGVRARRIQLGQTLKIIKGPFHAVVEKSEYRMDVFLNGSGGEPIYIRSFTVGLGEDNSTPIGSWVVRRGGKVANPGWTNPRTGKTYAPNDPKNPIGEYWIGLQGNDEQTRGLAGYGIHGTIEPDSVGQQVSMGCVRLQPDDIELVYTLLIDGKSTVVIKP